MIRTLSAVIMLALAALAGLVPVTTPAGAASAAPAPAQPAGSLMFIENAGQFDPAARFQVWGGQQIIWLADDAIWVTAIDRSQRRNAGRCERQTQLCWRKPTPAAGTFRTP